ncbi:MAG: hypothetical protein WB392_00135, partial [Methanotrichaceae archaeon]
DSYSTAKNDNCATGQCMQTSTTSTGDTSKYSDNSWEKTYPYEKCTNPNCSEYGKVYYANGTCPIDDGPCDMYNYCPILVPSLRLMISPRRL